MLGREVITLINGYKTQGRYSVNFDASKLAYRSGGLASGVYLCRMKAISFSETIKMIYQK